MIPRFCRQVAFRLTTVCRKQEKRFVPEQIQVTFALILTCKTIHLFNGILFFTKTSS